MFAEQAGAKHVYACEMSPTMCAIACQTFEANGVFVEPKCMKSTCLAIPQHIPERYV